MWLQLPMVLISIILGHIQHALSLEMSLHGILLPELVKIDPKYFNMLYN